MKHKTILLMLLMLVLMSIAVLGAGFNVPTNGTTVDQTIGTTLNVTVTNATNCAFTGPGLTSTNVVNDTADDTEFVLAYIPGSTAKTGCRQTLTATCTGGTNETHYATICVWDNLASDLDDIGIDIIGSAGAETKNWIPTFILLGMSVLSAGLIVKLKRG